jgi:predicted ATPase/DNA-binding SARP family transcriptional activator
MLKLSFLGTFWAQINETNIKEFESSKVRALLAYLMLESDRPHSREHLAGLFWADYDESRAGKSLRQALSNLRKSIQDNDANNPLLAINAESIRAVANHPQLWLDTIIFENLVTKCEKHPHRKLETCTSCAARLEQAAELYRGELLTSFFLKESDSFQNWLVTRREYFHQKIIAVLENLAAYYERRYENKKAISHARRLVSLDEWREESHALLMRLLASDSQRSAALKQYKTCCQILLDEFGAQPQPETTYIYQQILDNQISENKQPMVPNNLPYFGTTFVGRENEILEITEHLQEKNRRLVTVVGTGGVGKTRLALQTAQDQLPAFSDGIFWIQLENIETPESLPSIIANTLGIELPARGEPQTHILNFLRHRDLLLILDNFEHLVSGAGFITTLLNNAPGLSILATSREPLQLQAEWILELEGLPTRAVFDTDKPAALHLFEQRAQRIVPGFQLSTKDYDDALRLCESLDGLPLGIELAAILIKKFTCADIAKQIMQDVSLLSSSMRDVPVRHRSLLVTFDQSWNLLTKGEQIGFASLAVFPSRFSPQAALEVCGVSIELLNELCQKSLVRQFGKDWYSLHPLLRQYARKKQASAGISEMDLDIKFQDYYARLAQTFGSDLKSGNTRQALVGFSDDLLNLTTCWNLALNSKRTETLNSMLAHLFWFFEIKGKIYEGETLFQGAVAELKKINRTDAEETLYYRLLTYHGWLSFRRGNTDTALKNLRKTVEHGLGMLGIAEQVFATNHFGSVLFETGQKDLARHQHQKAMALSENTRVSWDEALTCNHYGSMLSMDGDLEQAECILQRGLAITESEKFTWVAANLLSNLAVLAYFRQDYQAAIELFIKSNAKSAEYGDLHRSPSVNHNNLAECYMYLGQLDKASEHLNLALYHFKECGNLVFLPYVYNTLASIKLQAGKLDDARQALDDGIQSALENQMNVVLNNLLIDYAKYFIIKGEQQRGAEIINYVVKSPDTVKEGRDKADLLLEEFSKPLREIVASLADKQTNQKEILDLTKA